MTSARPGSHRESVEEMLQGYMAGGLSRLEAIRTAVEEEKLERDEKGNLRLRSPSRKPGRQLLGI